MKTLEVEIQQTQEKLNIINRRMHPLEEARKALWSKRDALNEKKGALLYGGITSETPLEQIDLADLLSESGNDTSAKYQARKRFFNRFGLPGFRIGTSGYFPETGQVSIQIALSYSDETSVDIVKQALEVLLPHLKPLKDGAAHISIFEHTLSEAGCYSLHFKDGEITLNRLSWGHTTQLKSWADMTEALQYIRLHHWYDGKDDDGED